MRITDARLQELLQVKKELQKKAHRYGFRNREFSMSWTQMHKEQATLKIESYCEETPQKSRDSVENRINASYLVLGSNDYTYTENIKKYPRGYVYTRIYRICF